MKKISPYLSTLVYLHPPKKTPHNPHFSPILQLTIRKPYTKTSSRTNLMASINSSVLACKFTGVGSSDVNSKLPSSSIPMAQKMPTVIRAQKVSSESSAQGRRTALMSLGAALFAVAASTSSANAGIIDDYLDKSKANKELNDQKRLATSGANFARAYTVQFGTCTFPYNFTGCQDLAKTKKVPFISDDLEIECKGKDAYKCGSNVFWAPQK